MGGGTVTKVVETATQGLAIQRDAAAPGGCARRLKQRGMATKTGLYRSRSEPLEDIADGCVGGGSTPCQTECFVQPATMNIDEGDDAPGRIAPRHDGKNRKQQNMGQAVEFPLSPTRVGNFSQQIQQWSKFSHGNPRLRLPPYESDIFRFENPLSCQLPHFGRTLLQFGLSPGRSSALNSLGPRGVANADILIGGIRSLRLEDVPFSLPGATVLTYNFIVDGVTYYNETFLIIGG